MKKDTHSNNSEKKIAIVQSNYIPWKGYFDLINAVDEFILFDDMQYTKRNWRNRNKIKQKNGLIWLTIPVAVKGKYLQKIKDTKAANNQWRKEHWRTIASTYVRAKHFKDYKELFEELYLNSNEMFLSEINYRFMTAICNILSIHTTISWSMDYRVVDGKTERLIDLCKQAGANEYVSGSSAKGYINEALFKSERIGLDFIDYSGYPEYNQLYPPFEHKVSIIDLIFNEGALSKTYLKSF